MMPPSTTYGRRLHGVDKLIALGVIVATTLTLLLAGRTQGNTRDEGYYFDAAELYAAYYEDFADNLLHGHPQRSLTRSAVDKGFNYNHEHPALMKSLFGISWRLLHRCHCPEQPGRHPIAYTHKHVTLGLLDEESAMRLPTNLLVGIMAACLYLLGAAAWSRAAGLVAAVLAVAAPRFFFDAQLSCFDAPIAAWWVIVVFAYWRALDEDSWGWKTGVLFGFALASKLNAFFLPFVLFPHWLWVFYRRGRMPSLRPFVYMATLGVAVFLACWPWLWFDTVNRFRDYAAFHLHHVYYNMEYFGHNYNKPPFPLSFPYVMTALTVPVTTLALALAGLVRLGQYGWRHRHDRPHEPSRAQTRATGLLVAINAAVPMMVLTVTRAPIFGATKHFHATIPFLALLAGFAVAELAWALASAFFGDRAVAEGAGDGRVAPAEPARAFARKEALFAGALAVVACLPSVADGWRAHPYALSDYNLIAGGPPGGADLGMNRQFWGYSTRGVLAWIDQNAGRNASIYWHDTNRPQLNMDVREGRLRPDVRDSGMEENGVRASDIAMVIHEKHFNKYEYWIWDFYGTTKPALVLDDEGVPMVTVYQRPRK